MHSLLFPSAFSQGGTTYIKKACSCHPDIQTGCIQACSNLLTYYKRLTASRQTCSILPLGIPKGNIEHHFSTHLSKKTRAVSEGNHYWGNKLGKILLFPQRPKSRLKSTHLPKWSPCNCQAQLRDSGAVWCQRATAAVKVLLPQDGPSKRCLVCWQGTLSRHASLRHHILNSQEKKNKVSQLYCCSG